MHDSASLQIWWNCESNLTAFFRCRRRRLRRRTLSFFSAILASASTNFHFCNRTKCATLCSAQNWAICISYAYTARCVFRFNFFAVIISVDDMKSLNKYQFASTDVSLALVAINDKTGRNFCSTHFCTSHSFCAVWHLRIGSSCACLRIPIRERLD